MRDSSVKPLGLLAPLPDTVYDPKLERAWDLAMAEQKGSDAKVPARSGRDRPRVSRTAMEKQRGR